MHCLEALSGAAVAQHLAGRFLACQKFASQMPDLKPSNARRIAYMAGCRFAEMDIVSSFFLPRPIKTLRPHGALKAQQCQAAAVISFRCPTPWPSMQHTRVHGSL